jgi:hypothetical protein
MANSLLPVTELGFAEFTAGMITQTLEAVISAHADQERKFMEIRRIAAMSPEVYAVEFAANLGVDDEIKRRFPPPKNSELISAVEQNAPYIPAAENKPEQPAIQRLTGYIMVVNKDYRKQNGAYAITQTGHNNISQAIAVELAKPQLSLLQAMAPKGFPKVLVDNGRVSSKIVFKLYEEKDAAPTVSPAIIPGVTFAQLPMKKFMVSPVHAKGPEYLSLKADIVGEVEITFKTIIE